MKVLSNPGISIKTIPKEEQDEIKEELFESALINDFVVDGSDSDQEDNHVDLEDDDDDEEGAHSELKFQKKSIFKSTKSTFLTFSKVQKHIFGNFKNGKKSIFAPKKSLKL